MSMRSIFTAMAVVLAFAMVGFAGAAAERPIIIKFPHVVSESTPKGQGAKRFQELVKERLGGKVVVEVYPNSSLMSDDESLEALALGDIQMIAVSLSKFDRLTKRFQIFDLPFLFNDLTAVERFEQGPVGQKLLHELEGKGYLGLAYWHNGLKQLTANKPLHVPADASGLKFRIQESDVLLAQFRAVKANPQKMGLGEVYQALQTGAIDAQENTWSNIYTQKYFEVQKYATESNHGVIDYMVTVNTGFWKGLPAEVRGELEAIIRQVTVEVNAHAAALDAGDRERVLATGKTQLVKLTPEERDQWSAAMKPVWERFRPQIGEEAIAAALAANH
jgi:C4-dicarboxylate-binding protein DctP